MVTPLQRIAVSLIAAAASHPTTAFISPSIHQRCHGRIISTCKSTTENALWTEVAIEAAKRFTITQRQKLHDLGLLDSMEHRPIKIIGEKASKTCDIGDCVIDYNGDDDVASSSANDDKSAATTKIIHFERHGQGYHNLICDMYREFSIPIDFDSPDPTSNPVVRPEFLDPPLTALGIEQCTSQRDLCSRLSPECIIVSPMLRCIQTAKLSFRQHVNTIPWVCHEGCREELGRGINGEKLRILQ
jgi:hypothetical protein